MISNPAIDTPLNANVRLHIFSSNVLSPTEYFAEFWLNATEVYFCVLNSHSVSYKQTDLLLAQEDGQSLLDLLS